MYLEHRPEKNTAPVNHIGLPAVEAKRWNYRNTLNGKN